MQSDNIALAQGKQSRWFFNLVVGLRYYRKILLSFGLRGTLAGLSVVTTILFTRLLGPEQFGEYALQLSLCLLIAGLAQAGSIPLLVREAAIATNRKEVLGLGFRTLAIVVGLAALLLLLAAHLDAERFKVAPLLACGIVGLVIAGALSAALVRGMHHVIAGQVGDSIVRPSALILGATTLVLLGVDFDARAALVVYLASLVAALVLNLVLFARYLTRLSAEVLKVGQRGEPVARGFLGMALLGWFTTINGQLPPYLAGFLASPEQAGFYRLAAQFGTLLLIGLSAVEFAQAPSYSQAHSENDKRQLHALLQRSCRFSSALAIPAGVLLIFLADPMVRLLFGREFGAAAEPIRVLSLGVMANALTGNVGTLLIGCRKEAALARSALSCIILLVILCAVWIPRYGATGAALAQAVSLVARNAINGLVAWRTLGIVALPLARLQHSE